MHKSSPLDYPISRQLSEQINIYRLLLVFLVIYNHSYHTVSLFSDAELVLEKARWLWHGKYALSQVIGRSTVPGFFLISALLLYRKDFDWRQNIRRKLKSLAIPYLFFNLAWILLFLVLQQFSFASFLFGSEENIVKNWSFVQWADALLGFRGDLVPFLYPTWFLRDLLILNLFAGLIGWLMDRLPWPTLLLAVWLWFFKAESNTSVPDLQSICFWIFGAFVAKKGIRLELFNRPWMLLVLPVYAWFVYMATKHRYDPVYLPLHNMALFLGVFTLFAFSLLLFKLPCRSFLLRLSAYTFPIYLFHEFTTLTFRKLAAALFSTSALSQLLQYLLIPVAVVVFCLMLSVILKRISPRFFALITGGRA